MVSGEYGKGLGREPQSNNMKYEMSGTDGWQIVKIWNNFQNEFTNTYGRESGKWEKVPHVFLSLYPGFHIIL